MQRIIVTGGAGFVGANLVRQLQGDHPDARILVIDDMRTGVFANLTDDRPGFDAPFRGTMIARPLEKIDLRQLVRDFKPDVIFHEAAITDTTMTDQATMMVGNVEPFEALIDAARDNGSKLVWASSAATYGIEANGAAAARRPFMLEDAGRPANVYGFSKWVMENLHRQACADDPDLHIVGLRYFNVYGPGETHKNHMASMVHQLALQMLAGKRPRIFFDGTQARDQVYVKDVVSATIAAAAPRQDPRAGQGIYNVGSGTGTTFNEIVTALNHALGTLLEPEYFENPYSFYQDYTRADLARTTADLDWAPRYDANTGIEEYAQWLKRQFSTNVRSLESALAS